MKNKARPFAGRMRRIACAAAAAVFLASAAAWYLLYFTQTPQYALRELENAISERDLDRFDKRVDLDSLLGRAYDDLTAEVSASEQGALPEVQVVVEGFAKLFKQPLIDYFKENVRRYVETGAWNDAPAPDGQPIDLGETSAEIAVKSGLLHSDYRGLKFAKAAGDEAFASLEVCDRDTAQVFSLQLRLERRAETGWQIVEITNLRDYIRLIRQVKASQLEAYLTQTQPILEQYNTAVSSAEEKLEAIASTANLAAPAQREKIKAILRDEIIPAWQARSEALERIAFPSAAKELHGLRQRLCALQINCAQKDIEWTDDHDPATRKEANALRQEAALVGSQANALLFELRAALD